MRPDERSCDRFAACNVDDEACNEIAQVDAMAVC